MSRRQIARAENIDADFEKGEDAAFDDRDRMEKRADGRGRDHGGGQPAMERHERGLANAEGEESQQQRRVAGVHMALQNATSGKIQCARDSPCPDDGGEEKADGGGEQDRQIDARTAPRFRRAFVGHERISRERQQFIIDEEREEIGGECDAKRGGHRQREEHGKTRLMVFAIGAHIADRIERYENP